jgi:O-acetylhomoserine/O-acetylserine sulfhydrylase
MAASRFYKNPEFETIQLHGGQIPDSDTRARAVPIYQTASFCFRDADHAAEIFNMNDSAFAYTRLSNPTIAAFEQRMAQLEGGTAAVATASGQGAQFVAVAALARAGDNIISSTHLFSNSFFQFRTIWKNFGVSVNFVSSADPEAFAAAIDEDTKAIFIEVMGNPSLVMFDIASLAKVAHDHRIPLIVDNTFGVGGYLIRPFDHGADIIIHSATKWIGGHGTTIGGVVIDSGKFDWRSGKFPALTSPYRGVVYSERFGSYAYAAKVRTDMAFTGSCMNPFGAFLLLQGLETLSLRAERHSTNGMVLAKWLVKHPKVAWVSYHGLESNEFHQLAKKLMRPGLFGGMINFAVKGGLPKAHKFINSLKLVSNVANIGDAKTLITQPGAMVSILGEEDAVTTGITDDMLRLSTGLEAIDDIIADFEGAFEVTFSEDEVVSPTID